MTDESAVKLLRDVDALRMRVRGDRWGYWLPLLLIGVLILAAPLVYQQMVIPPGITSIFIYAPGPVWHIAGSSLYVAPLRLFGSYDVFLGDPTVVAVYWLGVVVVGIAATVAWYHWRGRRVGVETSTRTFLVVGVLGLLFLLGVLPLLDGVLISRFVYSQATFWTAAIVFTVSVGCGLLVSRRPRTTWRLVVVVPCVVVAVLSMTVVLHFASIQGYGPLLVIAMALLALAAVERSRILTVVTILFALAAILVNLYNVENVFYALHISSWNDGSQFVAFVRVLLPAAVLIVGGIVGAVKARKTSR